MRRATATNSPPPTVRPNCQPHCREVLPRRQVWAWLIYLTLVILIARKPNGSILYDGRVPGGRIDVATVARRLWDHNAPAMAPDAHRPLASLLIVAAAKVPGIGDLTTSYTVWRIIWLFGTVAVLQAWFSRFLSPIGVFAAILWYLLGFAYAGFDGKPDGWLEQLCFAGGFLLATAQRPGWLALLMAAGTWARESVVFLAGAYFLVNARRENWTAVFVQSAWLVGAWCASWSVVHYLVGHTRYYSELWRLPRNVIGFLNYLREFWAINMGQYLVVGIFGPLWVVPYLRSPRAPDQLEKLKWLLPVSLVFTMQLAKLWEVRVFYYHAMYLIPLIFWKLFPEARKTGVAPGRPKERTAEA
ncbi:MAG: hypothetical protein H5T86_02415 [Armatimonadetes bacterium]|nr:hypothetical protein [Armatimonadota bacterium]